MLNRAENWVLNGLLLFMLFFMISTGFAADDAATETADGRQAAETAQIIEEVLSSSAAENWRKHGPPGGDIVPVVAVLSIFGGPVVLVLCIALAYFWHKHKRRKMMHDTLNRMIDKGMDIPPHIASAFDDPQLGRNTAMRRGLLLSGLGIGLIIFFVVVGAAVAAGLGAIPLFIGLGYLLIWHLESRHPDSTDGA